MLHHLHARDHVGDAAQRRRAESGDVADHHRHVRRRVRRDVDAELLLGGEQARPRVRELLGTAAHRARVEVDADEVAEA